MNQRGATEKKALDKYEVLLLRAQGYTYRSIAAKLEMGITTAFDHVKDALAELNAKRDGLTEHYRTLELERTDELLDICAKEFDSATDWEKKKDIIETVLKIQDRRIKLLGLEAPQKHEHTGSIALDVLRERSNKIDEKDELSLTNPALTGIVE